MLHTDYTVGLLASKWAACVLRKKDAAGHNGLFFDTARRVCGTGSMKRSSVRPSVRPSFWLLHRSTAIAACSRFAAERLEGGRYRLSAGAGDEQQKHRTVLSGNAGSVMVTADVRG